MIEPPFLEFREAKPPGLTQRNAAREPRFDIICFEGNRKMPRERRRPMRKSRTIFADRYDAGRQLAERLQHLRPEHPVVLALPRGGVPVGFEIARALEAPLGIVFVRKIGAPWEPELALGAVVDGAEPEIVLDRRLIDDLGVPEDYIEQECAAQLGEIERRKQLYGAAGTVPPWRGRCVIVTDDGIATGSTARAALRAARKGGVTRLVLAVPVASEEAAILLRPETDEFVCLSIPAIFHAVGFHYADFAQIEDEEVIALLAAARNRRAAR
jgi:putative phosphoribosyl transferase